MSLLRRVFIAFVVVFYGLWQWLLGVWQVRVRRLDRKVAGETTGAATLPAEPQRIAIVAVYSSPPSLPFTLNLLRALLATDFVVIVVSGRPIEPSLREELVEQCHWLFERVGVGHDFGSYKMVLSWLDQHAEQFKTAETLILANDSVFYPKCCQAEIERMLRTPANWQAMSQSFESTHHAQSFFLLFRQPVFQSAAFRNFWLDYRAYSWRWHRVHRGEIRLSSALLGAGFTPEVAYKSLRLVEALLNNYSGWDLKWLAEISPTHDPEFGRDGVFSNAAKSILADARTLGADLAKAHSFMQKKWVYWWAHQMETTNPMHTTGLILNVALHAPIKRDICYRGFYDISQIIRLAAGFEEAELDAMRRDLNLRALPVSYHGLDRLLRRASGL